MTTWVPHHSEVTIFANSSQNLATLAVQLATLASRVAISAPRVAKTKQKTTVQLATLG